MEFNTVLSTAFAIQAQVQNGSLYFEIFFEKQNFLFKFENSNRDLKNWASEGSTFRSEASNRTIQIE